MPIHLTGVAKALVSFGALLLAAAMTLAFWPQHLQIGTRRTNCDAAVADFVPHDPSPIGSPQRLQDDACSAERRGFGLASFTSGTVGALLLTSGLVLVRRGRPRRGQTGARPGWYRDPAGAAAWWYWDGNRWTASAPDSPS